MSGERTQCQSGSDLACRRRRLVVANFQKAKNVLAGRQNQLAAATATQTRGRAASEKEKLFVSNGSY
jgi:hypothetical protein